MIEFTVRIHPKHGHKTYENRCKSCKRAHYKKKMGIRVEKVKYKSVVDKSRLRKEYNISLEELKILEINQNFSCAICKLDNQKLCIDHCHTTGKVRGLLCGSCNRGIGLLKENISTLNNAVRYLINSKLAASKEGTNV